MPQTHFDNYSSQINNKSYKTIKKIGKFLTKINIFLKWSEIVLLPLFLFYVVYFIFTQSTGCVSGQCDYSWLNVGLGIFKLEYSDSLFNFIVDYLMSFLAINGLVRIGLTFWINKKEGNFEWLFYLGLVGFGICYYFLSVYYEDFVYIHAASTKIFTESTVVEFILAGLVISSFLVFRDKYNWDRASFFTKSRLLFYSLHLVVCVVNINFGIIMFLISIPFQVIIDLRRRNHVHYHDPIWLQK